MRGGPQRENDAEIQRNLRRLNGTIVRDMQFTSCDGFSELATNSVDKFNRSVVFLRTVNLTPLFEAGRGVPIVTSVT